MDDARSAPKSMGTLADLLVSKKYWFFHFLIVMGVCAAGLVYLTQATYDSAPPLADFTTPSGEIVITAEQINKGKEVFHLRGLMSYGSFWGDGAERGPDFTADALHQITLSMKRIYGSQTSNSASPYHEDAIAARIKRELHTNGWSPENEWIVITEAQAEAANKLVAYYTGLFTDPAHPEAFHPGYISDPSDIEALSAFFFWGAWVAAADRPGETFSYTHNWPFDPDAGNHPTSATYLWSAVSVLVLFLGIGLVLYVYGQMKSLHYDPFNGGDKQSLTTEDLENGLVRPTQKSTYKFFAFAMALFGLQVVAGIVGALDFIRPFGLFLGDILPFTVARSYHTLFQIFWFFMCWVGYTIFFLPRLSQVPKGQQFLINLLFAACLLVGLGAVIGIYLGQTGVLTGEAAYLFGSQGWEFMELGRVFQILLLAAFGLWILIIYRGVKPWLTRKNLWSVPAWLLYGSGVMVLFLFFGLLVRPETNFAVADFWRWMVVHMWVEVTFEVFTTVIVAYMLVQMGLITRVMAERVIFLAVMLFFITATVGIGHNFYWIAKPTGVIALGSVFSTLQVLPLLLLTLDAWRMRQERERADSCLTSGKQNLVMGEVWLFILAVNFWNVFGAGVFGSLINLPIINYFEHATYLTGNHAHAAMFGVKGNIAIAGMLFCCQHLFEKQAWNSKLIRTAFWSLNIGIGLMMFLDLFPAGVYQFIAVLERGLWYARSQELIQGTVFQTLTWFRSIGGIVFVIGGVIPLLWFVWSRAKRMREISPEIETEQDTQTSRWAIDESA